MTEYLKEANINEILPKEIFVIIFKKLGFKSLSFARGTCKYWQKIIDDFEVLGAASRKFRHYSYTFKNKNEYFMN